jgi:hypothetical protein
VRHAFGVSKRVLQSKNRAPGVPEQGWQFQVEVLPHHIEIVDFGCERDFLGQHLICGSAPSPLVVVDEPKGIRQSIQVGQEIAVIKIRPAVEDDNGLPLPDLPIIERCLTHRNTAFAWGRGTRGLKRPRRTRRQPRHERRCKTGDDETSPHGHTLPFLRGQRKCRFAVAGF